MVAYVMNEYGAFPQRIERVAEIIKDYNPELELRFIPVEKRTLFDDKPFSVWHCPEGKPPYPVLAVREDEVDHRLIARLWQMDSNRHDPLAKLETEERAAQATRLKEELDQAEADREFTEWALRANKTVKHNGVTYQ